MGAAFHLAVSTGARKNLNRVAARAIQCLAGERTTAHTASRAVELTTKTAVTSRESSID
jgi:hypothetical protein